jgi:hypothetical protein
MIARRFDFPLTVLVALLLLASPASVTAAHAAAQRGSGARAITPPRLKVDPEVLDVGDVRPGQIVTGTVTLTNESDQPVVLIRTATSCACTVTSIANGQTIEPGGSLVVPIEYTGFEQHFGETGQQVVVFAEGFSVPVQIPVRANINRGIRPTVEFDPPSQYLVANVTLESIDGRPFRIESVALAPPVYMDGFDPERDEPRSRYIVRQDFSGLEPDTIPESLLIVTDHPGSPVMSLRVMNLEHTPDRGPRSFMIQQPPVLIHALPSTGVTVVEVPLWGISGEAYELLEWFEARADRALVTLLGVRSEPDRSLATLRLGIRPYPTHRGLLTIHVWATIKDHTEMTVLYGRVFAAEDLPKAEPAGGEGAPNENGQNGRAGQ